MPCLSGSSMRQLQRAGNILVRPQWEIADWNCLPQSSRSRNQHMAPITDTGGIERFLLQCLGHTREFCRAGRSIATYPGFHVRIMSSQPRIRKVSLPFRCCRRWTWSTNGTTPAYKSQLKSKGGTILVWYSGEKPGGIETCKK
jgi:hypothetical protein